MAKTRTKTRIWWVTSETDDPEYEDVSDIDEAIDMLKELHREHTTNRRFMCGFEEWRYGEWVECVSIEGLNVVEHMRSLGIPI